MQLKKIFLPLQLLIFISSSSLAQTITNANVALSNLASSFHFSSYNDSTKMVKDLNFVVLCNGTNIADVTPAFTVKVYIWDGWNYSFVKTYTNDGMHHFSNKAYPHQDIDLSGLQLPAGTYRLGVYVDADSAIANPPDDPADNIFLAKGDIVFTPANNTIAPNTNIYNTISVFPNPATEQIQVKWESTETIEKIYISDMGGQMLKQIPLSPHQNIATISTHDLASGIYMISIHSPAHVTVRRFSVVSSR